GNLVNWTHKDKILRVGIKFGVAHGTDPERVVALLMALAQRDADVLPSPVPVAILEGFGDFALQFALYVFVPEPALAGPVRHRLCAEIQRRFAEEKILIPLPSRELRVQRLPGELTRALGAWGTGAATPARSDRGSPTPPEPHVPVPGLLPAGINGSEHGR